jgi:hypothetical protein
VVERGFVEARARGRATPAGSGTFAASASAAPALGGSTRGGDATA